MGLAEDKYEDALYWEENGEFEAAFEEYQKAAELGHVQAMFKVALGYDLGKRTAQNYEEAVKWYREAAVRGHAGAQREFGYCYEKAKGVPQDYAEAVKWYRESAAQGYAQAQYDLGYCYKAGQGVPQDYEEAVKWYQKSAAQGHAKAQGNLGLFYEKGVGVPQDYAEAVKWYRESAAQGFAAAQYRLGGCYHDGVGVPQDYAEAVKWYQKSAEQGYAAAQCNLGYCYKAGVGVPRDYAEAVKWYMRSAAQGYARAQCNLGNCYKTGAGVLKDDTEAVKWYRESAAQGFAAAQYNLALCYELGAGVSKDYAEAIKWYQESAAQGFAGAKEKLDACYKKVQNEKSPEKRPGSAMEELDSLIGLDSVKIKTKEIIKLVQYIQKREKNSSSLSMHMVFTGNPGTGKTTVARLIAKVLYEEGILEKDSVVEVDRGDLVAGYVGQTALKTKEKIEEAMGGILFVDEAYALAESKLENDFGREAIDTLLKAMEDNRDRLIVIAAGYKEEMHRFVSSNPGLESRFKNFIDFPDYTGPEMMEIFLKMAEDDAYVVDQDAQKCISSHFNTLYLTRGSRFGNGREVRNFYQDVIMQLVLRTDLEEIQSVETITKADVEAVIQPVKKKMGKPAKERLDELIGLHSVKQEVSDLKKLAEYQKMCRDAGLDAPSVSMHMVFTGNPGTGKTTVARLIADIYYEMGLIPTSKCMEVDRACLVAEYIGKTAVKTREVIEQAMGGVLFIDEAYTLTNGAENDFGQEAVDTLLKMMEDSRGSLVVIVAGYTEEMNRFIDSNPGLKSRFTKKINFDDYSADELEEIFYRLAKDEDYTIAKDAENELTRIFRNMYDHKGSRFGNGREVRNFKENVVTMLAQRVAAYGQPDVALKCITKQDVLAAEERFLHIPL